MVDTEQTLKRLALTFTARDIMVIKEKLTCASSEISAKKLLNDNPDYDVIPIEQNGKLVAYLERGSESQKIIHIKDVISDATSILDLVDILKDRKFCFVLERSNVAGYIHFSDLNNQIVKIPFFVIIEALERTLIEDLSSLINESVLDIVLNQKRIQDIRKKMLKMRKNRANLNCVNLLSFNELVKFASHFHKIQIEKQEINIISKVRNLVFHSGSNLLKPTKT